MPKRKSKQSLSRLANRKARASRKAEEKRKASAQAASRLGTSPPISGPLLKGASIQNLPQNMSVVPPAGRPPASSGVSGVSSGGPPQLKLAGVAASEGMIRIDDYIYRAVQEYVSGDRPLSEQMFRDILNQEPFQPEALFRIGVIRGRAKHFLEAELLFRRAYRAAPDQYKLLRNYAVILQHQERWEEALALQQEALRHGKVDRRVVLGDIASSLVQVKRVEEAMHVYNEVLELDPENSLLHYNHALCCQHLGLNTRAEQSYLRSIELNPTSYSSLNNLAIFYRTVGREDEAEPLLLRALEYANPRYEGHISLFSYYMRLQKLEEAGVHIKKAKELEPDHFDVMSGQAELFSRHSQFDQALAIYQTLNAQYPDKYAYYIRMADCLLQMDQENNALETMEKMRQAFPDDPKAQDAYGGFMMQFGKLEIGFSAYERRFDEEELVSNAGKFKFLLPQPYLSTLDQARDKTVLVYAEQGIGDIVQFSRYLPMLNDQARRIRFLYGGSSTMKAFKRLFLTYPGMNESYEELIEIGIEREAFDVHCALMSLPHIFKTTIETIPPPNPPKLPAGLVEEWKDRLGPKKKPRIGLVVSGNMAQANDINRSSRLEYLTDLLSDRAEFMMVQRDLRDHDLELSQKLGLRHLGAEFTDLADTAAAYHSFDLILGVETGIMHLAGTFGIPTWMMLTTIPDWRYFRHRSDSPFYPSVRLFRQTRHGDWKGLASRTRQALEDYLDTL